MYAGTAAGGFSLGMVTTGYDWLLSKGYKPEEIILHGESLGTAVAAQLASRRNCAGVALGFDRVVMLALGCA